MTNPTTVGTLDALKVVAELKLISEYDDSLAREVLDRGFELSDRPEKWIYQVEEKLAELERTIQQSPYHRYLNGGRKPITSSGRDDWVAKDQYKAIQTSIAELLGFRERIKGRLGQGIGGTATFAHMLEVALCLTKILSDVQHTKADSSQLVMGPPKADDIRLCLAWAGQSATSAQCMDIKYLATALGDYEANRLLSARVAEHAAAKYYEALGHEVLDVSIGQFGSSDDRWKNHDLLVSGRPVDVKNARRSFSSHDSYVEHCVPKFKQSRGAEVSITGVLSEYRLVREIEEETSSCRILGEVTISEVRRLYAWARARFGHILNIAGIWNSEYQPGWIFEYPPEHYPCRNEAIAGIPGLIEKLKISGIASNRLPGWLLPLCPDRELALSQTQSDQMTRILVDLFSLNDDIGFSRPGLFIFVMGSFLESIANGEQTGQLEVALRELLIIRGSPNPRPLGLEDSQNYVVNLIGILVEVQNEAQRQRIKFSAFKLTHPSILRGQRDSGSWMTLLAYCGGWRDAPVRARCGATPLFFGQHAVCPNCGHLICDDCGYCSHGCNLVVQRQFDVATKQRISLEDGNFD